mmetsp:Transcript_26498/g.62247  ORF Transcript_26498/g.62247 Transcript_26498/m.62247 type:complete len:231 (+) Transcript_26498:4445-5137(+)
MVHRVLATAMGGFFVFRVVPLPTPNALEGLSEKGESKIAFIFLVRDAGFESSPFPAPKALEGASGEGESNIAFMSLASETGSSAAPSSLTTPKAFDGLSSEGESNIAFISFARDKGFDDSGSSFPFLMPKAFDGSLGEGESKIAFISFVPEKGFGESAETRTSLLARKDTEYLVVVLSNEFDDLSGDEPFITFISFTKDACFCGSVSTYCFPSEKGAKVRSMNLPNAFDG